MGLSVRADCGPRAVSSSLGGSAGVGGSADLLSKTTAYADWRSHGVAGEVAFLF